MALRDNVIPDLSAWKTDDLQWVKERKQQWRSVRIVLEYRDETGNEPFYYAGKKYHKRLKEFFLTGGAITRYPEVRFDPKPNDPLGGITAELLLYLWLHPDHSQENWERIRDALSGSQDKGLLESAQDRFMESMRAYPREGWLFGEAEIEKKLYRFLFHSEGEYEYGVGRLHRKKAWCGTLEGCIRDYFQTEYRMVPVKGGQVSEPINGSRRFAGNPNHLIRHCLDDFVDLTWFFLTNDEYVAKLESEKPAFGITGLTQYMKFFTEAMAGCCFALMVAEENDPAFGQTAQELLDLM